MIYFTMKAERQACWHCYSIAKDHDANRIWDLVGTIGSKVETSAGVLCPGQPLGLVLAIPKQCRDSLTC